MLVKTLCVSSTRPITYLNCDISSASSDDDDLNTLLQSHHRLVSQLPSLCDSSIVSFAISIPKTTLAPVKNIVPLASVRKHLVLTTSELPQGSRYLLPGFQPVFILKSATPFEHSIAPRHISVAPGLPAGRGRGGGRGGGGPPCVSSTEYALRREAAAQNRNQNLIGKFIRTIAPAFLPNDINAYLPMSLHVTEARTSDPILLHAIGAALHHHQEPLAPPIAILAPPCLPPKTTLSF